MAILKALLGTSTSRPKSRVLDVTKESGEPCHPCIANRRSEDPLKIPEPIDIHLHRPADATRKDGPKQRYLCIRVSLTEACVPTNIAMTGEITLKDRVSSVSGIMEVLGAPHAHVAKVLLPWANWKDEEDDVE